MEFITKWLEVGLLQALPEWDLSGVPGKERGKLRLSPEHLLEVIHAEELAEWSLGMAQRIERPRLKKRGAGAPQKYRESSVLLMAVVQSVWRKSYEQIIDYVASHPGLARQMGFGERTISKGQRAGRDIHRQFRIKTGGTPTGSEGLPAIPRQS